MGTLDGRTAIVTGAGRGIGRAEALLLAAEGAKVLVNDVDGDHAKAVVDEIAAAGGEALANSDDVASWSGAEAIVDRSVAEWGQLDILVTLRAPGSPARTGANDRRAVSPASADAS
jgi:NAD(P)-dependent dehydrogenase (short-subunit alcohol dehydrogenase family)